MLDLSAVTSIKPPQPTNGQLYLSWVGTTPTGGWYQVYVDRVLTWTGTRSNCTIQAPAGRATFDIGAVGPTERFTDFSSDLPVPPADKAYLTWIGGTYEGPDIAGWGIYTDGFGTGGWGDNLQLGYVAAVEAGVYTDGFGYGGFGQGGYGAASGNYSWTSTSLTSGTYGFAVVPFDSAGNEGTAASVSQTILVAPLPPALDSFARRLEYSYTLSTHTPNLNWLASPG